MQYVAKLTYKGDTSYGYDNSNDCIAVNRARDSHPNPDDDAILTVYREYGNGSVELAYTSTLRRHLIIIGEQ